MIVIITWQTQEPRHAVSHPSALYRRQLRSARFASFLQRIARGKRKLARQAPCVHYFHQVDDPYSHLAVQKLDQLRAQYALPFVVHLVSESADDYKGSADDFAIWAQRDAVAIAAGYAATLDISHSPTPSQILQANRTLSPHLTSDTFAPLPNKWATICGRTT